MSDLRWTAEKPMRPGWYWARYPRPWCPAECVVEVTRDGGTLYVDVFEDGLLRLDLCNCFEWAGPIPEPLSGPA